MYAIRSYYDPLEDVQRGLPGDDSDEQARWIEATVVGKTAVRICGLYLPNGNPVPGPVITSYSIHYTKLYEWTAPTATEWPRASRSRASTTRRWRNNFV